MPAQAVTIYADSAIVGEAASNLASYGERPRGPSEYPVTTTAASTRPSMWAHQAWSLAGVVSLCIAATVGAVLLNTDGYHVASLFAIIAAAGASIGFFRRAWRIHFEVERELERMERKYGEVYGRAGISIWEEDWSAVGDAIARLRERGVIDIAAWFDVRPEEARALHAQVMITGVNRYTVGLMRAHSEAQLIGSLAQILPGSIASFGRWLAAFARGDTVYVGESVIQRCDGEPLDCFVTAALPKETGDFREIIVSVIEITGYKRDQARLAEARDEIARAQRIATVGALTASIAHEINSPLAAVSSNAAACRRWLDRPAPDLAEAKDAVGAVIADVERVCAVIERTRGYLQKADRAQERRDLKALIRESLELVDREADSHEVCISLVLADDLGEIVCDPVRLQQAFVNLMVNAIQAMGASDRERRLMIAAARGEGLFRITVEDTGPGIAAEDLRRIFEPFYSTRTGGMGMGLSICRTAIEAHGGTLSARSTLGMGTCFEIRLPDPLT
ncbi:MAG: hypothetical protein EOO76_00430 [Novosphingobium sp.]|nr:MAG: hypothetical protein EOO76_00430 [Novosphingobium sp.]